jgi:hypothetical protein
MNGSCGKVEKFKEHCTLCAMCPPTVGDRARRNQREDLIQVFICKMNCGQRRKYCGRKQFMIFGGKRTPEEFVNKRLYSEK